MSQKKHIDRLFQEKFKDFDASPDKQVWKNIEKQLQKNTSNTTPKLIPIWLRISGIAAAFIVLLTSGIYLSTSTNTSPVINTKSNKEDSKITLNKQSKLNEINTSESNGKVVYNSSDDKKLNHQNYDSSNNTDASVTDKNVSKNKLNTINSSTTNDGLVNNNSSKEILISPNSKHNIDNKTLNLNNTKEERYSNKLQKNTKNNSSNTSNKDQLVNSSSLNNHLSTNTTKSIKNYTNTANNTLNKLSPSTLKKQNLTKALEKNSSFSANYSKKQTTTNSNTTLYGVSKPLVLLAPDSISSYNIIIRDAKSIEAAIAESEKLLEKEKIGHRWSVSPNIAPVYYNSFGEGSQFGSQFNNNSKSGEVNTSYGVSVGYTVNKKIKVRTGINKLNLSYDTEDIIVFKNVNDTKISSFMNIDFYSPVNNLGISIISSNNLARQQINSKLSFNAALSQQITYLEVPIELEYTLNNSRFTVSIIGGLSTFLLENNIVVSEFDGYKSDLGEANNINNVSFSTNLGLGLNYKFSKSFIYIFEPTFKYQINGFSNTSGNFNPYIIGVYTGFSYKF